MNRPLKFRVWDAKMTEMFYPYAIVFSKEEGLRGAYGHHWYEDKQHLWEWDIPWEKKYTVMQFTGLTDKNGVEIYENDILKYSNPNQPRSCPLKIVEWRDSPHYGVGFNIGGPRSRNGGEKIVHYEVIGNTLQNPELVK